MSVTWNPADKNANISLSNGDLTATATDTSWKSVRATEGKSSGKWYWEVKIDVSAGDHNMIGTGSSSATLDHYVGNDSYGYGYNGYNGYKFYDGSGVVYGSTYGLNDIIGVALDLDNGKIWVSKNNVWQASGDPAAGTNEMFSGLSGTFYPMFSPYENTNAGTARFASGDLSYTPPSGFSALEEIIEITDGVGVNDTLVRLIEGLRTLQNNAGFDDQLEAINLTDIITNDAGLSDQFEAFSLTDEISNDVGISDQLEVVVLAGKITEESGFDESLSGILEISRSVSDEAGVNDQLDASKESHRSIEETFGIADSWMGAVPIQKIQALLNPFGINGVHANINSSGIQTYQTIPCGIPIYQIQSSILQLGVFVAKIQASLQEITESSVETIQAILQTINEKEWASGIHVLLQSLKDQIVAQIVVNWDLYFDNISIKKEVTEIRVTFSEASPHNSIDVLSSSENLFKKMSPYYAPGTSRLRLELGTRVLYFLFEEKSGSETAFSFSGRSLSAREENPYAKDLNYSIEYEKLASEVALEILTVSSRLWESEDWVLPKTFEFQGPPMVGIRKLADAIGAVVRCDDAGNIVVRNKFPVRPVDMGTATISESYDRSNIIILDYRDRRGSQYNAVEVKGRTSDVFVPDHRILESSPGIGTTVHIDIFWGNRAPLDVPATYVTSGKIIRILTNQEVEMEETCIFREGASTLSLPITSIKNIAWIGASGGSVVAEPYSKVLKLENAVYRIAKVKYTSTYNRYRLYDHNVEMLLALIGLDPAMDISVIVKMGAGDYEASPISNALLTSESIARVRGTAFLDDHRYDFKEISLRVPYSDNLKDGLLTYLNDARIQCLGNFHVRENTILIKGPQIISEVGAIQCRMD